MDIGGTGLRPDPMSPYIARGPQMNDNNPGSAGRWPAPAAPDQHAGVSTTNEAAYCALALTKIQRGRADIEAGRLFTTDHARARLRKWLTR